jgi:hypothetical protein
MEASRHGSSGFIAWAEEAPGVNGVSDAHGTARPAPEPQVRLAAAEAHLAAMREEVQRLQGELRASHAEAGTERRLREEAERGRHAAEQRLADTREAVWRWIADLARTPFWRLRRALSITPPELHAHKRLPPPTD